MSHKERWKYGDTNPVVAAVDSETVIEIGDLLWQDVDNARPASMLLASTAMMQQQAAPADNFLGVAIQRSHRGDATPIRVATTGVFEFDCPSGTFELGDLVGVTANQRVAVVPISRQAIARVARREPRVTTSVLIDIRSTVMTGGILKR